MKRPTVSQSDMHEFVHELRAGSQVEPKISMSGEENSLSTELVEEFVADFKELKDSCSKGLTKSKDKKHSEFEREASPLVVRLLEELPMSCRFDPGFWSYLSYRVSDVITWRYPPNEAEGWSKNFVASHASSDFVDGFLPRLAIKGLIATGSADSTNLTQQDFWRSHILRVKTGFSKNVSQAFAEAVVRDQLVVEKQRSMAKSIRSIRSNVIFEVLNPAQAKAIVDDIK